MNATAFACCIHFAAVTAGHGRQKLYTTCSAASCFCMQALEQRGISPEGSDLIRHNLVVFREGEGALQVAHTPAHCWSMSSISVALIPTHAVQAVAQCLHSSTALLPIITTPSAPATCHTSLQPASTCPVWHLHSAFKAFPSTCQVHMSIQLHSHSTPALRCARIMQTGPVYNSNVL